MKKVKLILSLLFLSYVVFGGNASTIKGYIKDVDVKSPIEKVKVELYQSGNYINRDYTDVNGYYEINNLDEGTYDIVVTHIDYIDGSSSTFVADSLSSTESINMTAKLVRVQVTDIHIDGFSTLQTPATIDYSQSFILDYKFENIGNVNVDITLEYWSSDVSLNNINGEVNYTYGISLSPGEQASLT